MTALLAITLLSLLVAGASLIVTRGCILGWRDIRDDAITRINAATDDANEATRRQMAAEEEAIRLRASLAHAERRARSRESKYSRRQPDQLMPLTVPPSKPPTSEAQTYHTACECGAEYDLPVDWRNTTCDVCHRTLPGQSSRRQPETPAPLPENAP